GGAEVVDEAVRVVGEDHALGVSPGGQGGDRLDPFGTRVEQVQPETVHAEQDPGVGQFGQVVQVVAVARVPDHHLGQVHAFLAEDPQRDPAGLVRPGGVHGDGRAGLDVRPGDGAGDALDAGAGLGGLQGELEEGGLDPGADDALGDVAGEVGDHRLGHVDEQAGTAVGVLLREFLVHVQAGRDHDVDRRLRRDPLRPRDVAAQPPYGRVDDRRYPLGGHGVELVDGAGDHRLLVPPVAAVVLHVLGGEHEEVLVHQGLAEVAQVDRPANG